MASKIYYQYDSNLHLDRSLSGSIMSSNPVEYLESDTTSECETCKIERAILVSRKKLLCKNCFIRFIRGKQRKQMQDEKYRVKYGAVLERLGIQKILLCFSGGQSSLVLFDVISSLLQEQTQAHNGKQGFELVILHLDEYEMNSLNKSIKDIMPKLLEMYSSIDIKLKVLSLDSYILDQGLLKKVCLDKEFVGVAKELNSEEKYTLNDILALCPNKSSVEDLLTIIYDELSLRVAYIEGCETILYAHSMTRIANEIIALTVKGRGSSIYKAISDHTTSFRGRNFQIIFPLRDVLLAEIAFYVDLAGLKDCELFSTKAKSRITKNMTVRDITTNYFKQLDATGYASTASTVVKTGEKLGAPNFGEDPPKCQICGIEIHQDPKNWLRRITVDEPAPLVTEEEYNYAAQYKEAFSGTTLENINSMPINICYGCTVTLGSGTETGFIWPIKTEEEEKAEILNEYILTDDES